MTTGKTVALTRRTFVGRIMSLLFNMLSSPRSGAVAKRSYPTPEVRGGGREEQPHVQGAAAARAQEGREELLHVQGQEGQP